MIQHRRETSLRRSLIAWSCRLGDGPVKCSRVLEQGAKSYTKSSPLTMDTSAREAMKDAAKCDKHCDLQISANQQISERIMRERGLLFSQACVSVLRIISFDYWKQFFKSVWEVYSSLATRHLWVCVVNRVVTFVRAYPTGDGCLTELSTNCSHGFSDLFAYAMKQFRSDVQSSIPISET